MKRILHILKQKNNVPLDIICQQAMEVSVEVVLIQEAVSVLIDGLAVFVLEADLLEKTAYKTISYPQMLEKIFNADTVVIW